MILTAEQAVKFLGIGRSTAYELVHTGSVPSIRLGRRIAYQLGTALSDIEIATELRSGVG